ncbi:Spy/CpxP family protein refolding chaperone [Candidimonas nitroreducens]|uniref:LTXXQ motif family protein n=1 Tax=Candidimonas nitroreducens TaxID=683354 RepID=A0A225MX10_9BURK|nr:Spy/CpxP family protein refolding chaperone [Candidimonas nitroreducens]OWT65612.1 hypothetical protein CEY11_02390 [Candidimonas nitroreducens]
MQYLKTPMQAAIAAVAAAFAMQGAAMAAPAAEAPAQGPAMSAQHHRAPGHHGDHGHMRHHGPSAALWVPGYGPVGRDLLKSLKLSDAQSKLVTDAQAAQKSAMKERFALMKKQRKEYVDGMKAGKLDPHAAAQQADEAMQKSLAERQEVTKKWLAVWDSLDGTQQKQVAAYLKGRADGRKAHRHPQFEHASHHGWHGNQAPKAPPAPAAEPATQTPAPPAS